MADSISRRVAEYSGMPAFADVPVYDYYWRLEKYYDDHWMEPVMQWLLVNWSYASIACVVYVTVIFSLKHYMRDRPRLDLRLPLAVWSTCLAIFSFFGMIRSIPELSYMLRTNGYRMSVCNPSYMWGPTAIWQMFMVLSKFAELGDTVFIVLRKQPLIFLHWYHHLTVLLYGCYSFSDPTAPGRWFVTMNFSVHTLMYTYYALRAFRFAVPKYINMIITTSQMMQMLIGMFSVLMVIVYKHQGYSCSMSHGNLYVSAGMYLTYFLLFAYFFYNAYLKPKPKAKEHQNGVVHVNGNGKKAQ